MKSSSESAFAIDPWTTYENLFRKNLLPTLSCIYNLSAGINITVVIATIYKSSKT